MHVVSKKLMLCVGLAAVIASSGFAANTLTVNVDSAKYVVKSGLYSLLMEKLGRNWGGGVWVGTSSTIPNTNGMRNDIIEGMKDAGVGGIEWPGGCAACSYNWSSNKNPANDVGTDRFMQLCGLVGCEPVIAVPPKNTSAATNLSWIKYINQNPDHPEWHIKYVKIGNENWGCCGSFNVTTYLPHYQANYDSLKTIKNPENGKNLFIIAGTALIGNFSWQDTMLKKIPSEIDGVEIHDYIYKTSNPCVNFTPTQYLDVVGASNKGQIAPRIDTTIKHLNTYDPQLTKRIKIIEDEWGDWFANFDQTNQGDWFKQVTILDMLSAAQQLHLFMKNADYYEIAALAQGVNCLQSLFLTNNKNQSQMVKTTSFYLFKMFKPHHANGAEWAPNTLSSENWSGSVAALSAGTTVDSFGRVNISVSNVDTLNTRPLTITLNSKAPSYTMASAQIITGPKKNSYNDFGVPEIVNIQPFADSNFSLTNGGKTITVKVPPISCIMLQLTPPTGVKRNELFPKRAAAGQFSIKSGLNGTIAITALASQDKSVKASLYTIEGKLVERSSLKFPTANCSINFGRNLRSNGMYMVKLESENGSFSKNVLVTR